jgi:hypothetical protein
MDGLHGVVAAVGLSNAGVDFGAADGKTISVLFGCLCHQYRNSQWPSRTSPAPSPPAAEKNRDEEKQRAMRERREKAQ